jgi:hypothetical protein
MRMESGVKEEQRSSHRMNDAAICVNLLQANGV